MCGYISTEDKRFNSKERWKFQNSDWWNLFSSGISVQYFLCSLGKRWKLRFMSKLIFVFVVPGQVTGYRLILEGTMLSHLQ